MRLALILALTCSLTLPSVVFAQTAPSAPSTACNRDPLPQDDPEPSTDYGRRATAKDPCAVADENLAREEAEILKAKPAAAAAPRQVWDRKSQPQFLKSIIGRFDLQPAELAVLNRTGVVVPARLEARSYSHGYHEIFQSQLPVYITADSIFHAVFASHQTITERLENLRLSPMLSQALDDMHGALVAAAPDYPPDVARDLDLYLLVARRLIADPYAEGAPPRSAFGDAAVEREAGELVEKATCGERARDGDVVRPAAAHRLHAIRAARPLREQRADAALLPRRDVGVTPGVQPGLTLVAKLGAGRGA